MNTVPDVSAQGSIDTEGLISVDPSPTTAVISGLLLLSCAVVALFWANSPWSGTYHAIWHAPLGSTTMLHVVNDGLMALFFLMVGLEIKHELQDGALSTIRQAALPVVGAIGGMVAPALLFALIARDSDAARGWGIPMATDIAFALGIVALLKDRVPTGLRVFLAALAIADDIGAVLVIALFYTPTVSVIALSATAAIMILLFGLTARGVRALWPYVISGVLLWYAVFSSGIHASIAGVLLAFTIPAQGENSVQARLEHLLHAPVSCFVVPVFAFANAGVTLPGNLAAFAVQPAVIATAIGLLIGKPLGITAAAYIAVRANWATLPDGANFMRVLGVAALGGIGFTMSLFIAALAFGEGQLLDAAKVGVIAGSLVAGTAGAVILALQARAEKAA